MSIPRKLWRIHGGLHLPGHKAESMQQPITDAPVPPELILPLQQHIGNVATPIVNVGDRVLKNQIIARAEGYVSVPIHASSSGTVIAIEPRVIPHPSHLTDTCIVIATDGKDEATPVAAVLSDYRQMDPAELRNRIRDAGIVGLGGAGFPAFIKLNPGPQLKIHTLILNGAECEPYITCDAMLMQEQPRAILDGLRIMQHALHAQRCIIGIEDNKPAALQALQAALHTDEHTLIEIVAVPTLYPAGGEKQLIKTLTGLEVPSHQLPASVGVICHNVATAYSIAQAISHQQPLIERIVTVAGPAIPKACNYRVRLGTPMKYLIEHTGASPSLPARLIMGGPMMGFAINDLQTPVIKTTNCLLALTSQELPKTQFELPCIRCGECARACPAQLLPQQLFWHAHAKDFDKIQDFNLFDCIECGCCSYVCPSHIPLVQYYRFAKTEIWAKEREKSKSDIARQRHEFHLQRLERKKREDEERKRKKKEMLDKVTQTDSAADAKKAAIAAALQRAQAKKATQASPQNVEHLSEQQRQQIDEIDKRRANPSTVASQPGKDNES